MSRKVMKNVRSIAGVSGEGEVENVFMRYDQGRKVVNTKKSEKLVFLSRIILESVRKINDP